jgi:hypothetical protein
VSRILDVSLIGLVWVVARVPLLVYRYPPQVQFDSFSHRPFWIAVLNPHHPPLYGTFLALVPPVAVIVLQHLMVYVSAVCLYEIVRRSANRFGGLVSAAFVVTYGDFVLYGHTFMSETSFNFFLALHLLTLWYAIERKSPAWYFLSGLCIGTGALTRASLQYQAVLVAAVLLPFSARPLRRLKAYGRSMAALFGGFLVVCLPWVAATWLVYGEWVISSGLPKVMMERMVLDPMAPLTEVPLEDSQLREMRDYIVSSAKNNTIRWSSVYAGIRAEILGVGSSGNECSNNRKVDPYVRKLWWKYVKKYPWRYFRASLIWIVGYVVGSSDAHSSFCFSQDHSSRVLSEVGWFGDLGRFRVFLKTPPTSKRNLEILDRIYLRTALLMMFPPVVVLILIVGAGSVLLFRGVNKIFMLQIYATMVYLTAPLWVSTPILRYRYPFDLCYALVLGMVCGTLSALTAKKRL